MKTAYDRALELVNSNLYGLELIEIGDDSFLVEGVYFTLDFQPIVGDIQLHVSEKTDIIIDSMMEELAEMTVLKEQLQPFMDEISQ